MTRLETARAQLAQVEDLLRTAPDDAGLLALAAELRESIRLSLSLEATLLESASSLPVSSWSLASVDVPAANAASAVPEATTVVVKGAGFAVGSRCEVKRAEDKRWQAAFVQRRLPKNEFEVHRLYDEQVLVVKEDEIRPIISAAGVRLDFIKPGVKLHARYSGDGKFYPVTVKSKTDHGGVVVFEGYGNEEHCCVEHMKIVVESSLTSSAAAAAAGGGAAVGAAGTGAAVGAGLAEGEIPKNLVLLPTDSEAVKMAKIKKQRALQRRAKEALANKIEEEKQTKWQAFQATSKRVKGALTDPGAESLFSSAFKR